MLVSIHKQNLICLFIFIVGTSANAQEWSLQQCLDSAQAHNKTLQIAENNKQLSVEKHKEATANLIPKVNVNADYKYFFDLPTQLMPLSTFNPNAPVGQFKEAQFGVPHNVGANIQLTMPIYNPQLMSAIKSTNIAEELSQLQYKKTQEQIYTEVCNLYYNAQILTKQLAFVDSNLINTSKLLSTIKLLKEQQMAKGTDVSKVELQLAQLQVQQTTIKNKLEQVLAALKFTIGVALDKPMSVSTELNLSQETDYPTTNVTDISIVKAQNRLALTELKNTKRIVLPSLSLIASYGTTGFGYNKKPNDFLKFFPVSFTGIQFSYPLFAGTVTLRKINQKKLELKNSELQLGIATEQNKMQVNNATMQRTLAKQTIQTTQLQIVQAQSIYQQTLLLNKQGMASITDVLLADNSVREAQQSYLSAIVDYLKADIEIKRLTGNVTIKN